MQIQQELLDFHFHVTRCVDLLYELMLKTRCSTVGVALSSLLNSVAVAH